MLRPAVFPILYAMLTTTGANALGAQTVAGRVLDADSREPLPFATISIRSAGVEVGRVSTDSVGRFTVRLDGRVGDDIGVTARRIGHRPLTRRVRVSGLSELAPLEMLLEPLPARLRDVTSSAERRTRRLTSAGFFERADAGLGHFITEDDIRRQSRQRVTDLLLGVPGLGRVESSQGHTFVLVRRAQGRLSQPVCPPRVIVDGVIVATPLTEAFDFDAYLRPDHIAGIEVYTGPAELPAVFGGAESDCGVIVVWTK